MVRLSQEVNLVATVSRFSLLYKEMNFCLTEDFMNRYCILVMFACALLCGGCFKHKEAPHRPVTANSIEKAVEIKADVERIVLTGSRIGDLPAELSSMPKLSTLLLRGAEIKSLSVLAEIPKLEVLDITATAQGELPDAVTAVSSLKQLYLAENKITALSAKIGSLINLEYLNLDRNELTSLPVEIGSCVKMRWLRLNNNKLTELPASVSGMKQLQRIYLLDNQLAAVPECLKDLPLLEDIDLSGNPVTEFPDWLTTLPKVRQLNFDNCKITKLPDDLTTLAGLKILSLGHCPVPKEEKLRIREALPDVQIMF
jgi:leucine-rich repeat protein SHOC2